MSNQGIQEMACTIALFETLERFRTSRWNASLSIGWQFYAFATRCWRFCAQTEEKKKRNELSNSVLWNGITKINLLLDISIARLSQAKCESSILSNIYTYMCVCMCILTDWFTNDLKIWNLLRKHEFLFEQWNYQHVSIRSIPNN